MIIYTILLVFGSFTIEADVPACAVEDADNCYWDASTRGNGHGASFVALEGVVYYDPQVIAVRVVD